jgi:hypothetical protein
MAEAARKAMEDRFGTLSDEYVRRMVIRICKDADEYVAYFTGASQDTFLIFAFGNGEITDFTNSYEPFPRIMDGIAWHYLGEKQDSYFDMPYWLRTALSGYLTTAQLKGRRVVFERTPVEEQAFAALVKNNRDKIKSPEELMQLTAGDVSETFAKEVDLRFQFLSLLRFFEGPGRKHKLLKDQDFLIDYMRQVNATTEELNKATPVKFVAMKEATTEEEEAAQARDQQKRSQDSAKRAEARAKELLAAVVEAACPWTLEEWESLTTAYNRYARSR